MKRDLPLLGHGSTSAKGAARYRRPQTLPEQIAEEVSGAIRRGELNPGDPIKEQDLSNLFQVSRGPVREALRILEKDGVVRILPNRGARVTQLTVSELAEVYEIRAALTQLSVRHLCDSQDDDLRQNFIEGAERIREIANDPEAFDDYLGQSYKLSSMLSSSSSNGRLAEMMQSLTRQTIRYTLLGLRRPERRHESAAIWKEVAEAVRERNVEEAGRLIGQLIIDSKDAAVAEMLKDAATAPDQDASASANRQ